MGNTLGSAYLFAMLHIRPNDIVPSVVDRPRLSGGFVRPALESQLANSIMRIPPLTRIVAMTAVWGVAYQVVAAIVQLVCLGFLIRSVGREQFGLWMVISALTMWPPLLMFGQANIILTRLTIFTDYAEARRVLTSSLVVCLVGAGAALLAVLILVPFAPWKEWLNIQNAGALSQATPTAIAAVAVAIVAVPASLSSFAMLAGRRGVLNHQIMIAAQLICFVVFLLSIRVGWPLWALGSILVAPLGMGGIVLFVMGPRRGYFPRPQIAAVDFSSIKRTLGPALTLFLFDLATILLQRTPELMVVRVRGINEVAALGAGSRLSLFLLAIIQAILVATWPMISESVARDDWRGIRRALIGSLGTVLLIWGAGSGAIWLFGSFFVEKWTGIPQLVSRALFMAIILQSLSQGLQSWIFTALSALSMFKTQMLAMIGAVMVYFILAPILGLSWGAVGVLLAQSAGIIGVALPIGLLSVARCFRLRELRLTEPRGDLLGE